MEDIYSEPVKGRKGRKQETGNDWKEKDVDIYDRLDARVAEPQEAAQSVKTSETHTAPANPQNNKKHLQAAAGCLALLCVLLLAALVGLAVHLTGLNEELWSALGNVVKERNLLQTAFNTTLKQQDALRKNLHAGNLCTCWKNTDCSCYYISKEKKNWMESRRDCMDRGSDLIVVNSEEEQEFVKFVARATEMFWLGLTDKESEGTWKWVDGASLTTGYWGPSQPDNNGPLPDTEEDCAEHFTKLNGWNDLSCFKEISWVCEKHLDLSVLSNLHDYSKVPLV